MYLIPRRPGSVFLNTQNQQCWLLVFGLLLQGLEMLRKIARWICHRSRKAAELDVLLSQPGLPIHHFM